MDGEEHTVETDARDSPPLVRGHLTDRRHRSDAGVREHDGQAAELPSDIVDSRLHRCCISDVNLDSYPADLGSHRVGALGINIEHRDTCALLGKPVTGGSAD